MKKFSVFQTVAVLWLCCLLPLQGMAQAKKEIRCYWIGSSSTPPRLLRTFDDFVNAGSGYSTRGSVRGDTVRLDWLAGGVAGEPEVQFKNFKPGDFDYVIIQVSMGFVRDQKAMQGMGAVIGNLCRRIRELGAEPVLWEAYAATEDRPTGRNTAEMQTMLHDALLKAAAENNALFVPAGSSWQEVRMTGPQDRLYLFSAVAPGDLGHTGPRGNFILGAAIYAAVTGENPVENPNLTAYEMEPAPEGQKGLWASTVPFPIDEAEAAHFKEVVWKHEQKAREDYAALGGTFVPPARLASGVAAAVSAPSGFGASAAAVPAALPLSHSNNPIWSK